MRSALTTFVVTALLLAGCSSTADDAKDAATPSPSPSASTSPTEPSSPSESTSPIDDAIEIEIEGGKISPRGDRVKVKAGEVITLKIDSDRAGELHVHSTPEQEFSFDKGKSTIELTIDTPGVVDVEEHETGVVVLQLEVN